MAESEIQVDGVVMPFEDFVLDELIRLGKVVADLRRENVAVLARAEEKLEAVSHVRDSLGTAAGVKLIHRDRGGDITSIEEFGSGR